VAHDPVVRGRFGPAGRGRTEQTAQVEDPSGLSDDHRRDVDQTHRSDRTWEYQQDENDRQHDGGSVDGGGGGPAVTTTTTTIHPGCCGNGTIMTTNRHQVVVTVVVGFFVLFWTL
jgi:hypothetical protein